MGFKLVSAVLMLALVLSGPLAPLAWAQEKTEGQMAPAKTDDGAWKVAAGVVNAVRVPGKALLCATAGWVGVAVLLVTWGNAHEAAGGIWNEGCGGSWTVTAEDLKPKGVDSEYLTERPDWQKSDYQRTQ